MPIKSLNNKDSYYNYLAESGSLQGTLYNWGGNRGIWAGGSNGGPYEVTIDDASGCFGIDSIFIDHIDKPTALFDESSFCVNDSSVFTDTSTFFNNLVSCIR